MALQGIEVCVFDAYGTLFDVHSAVARHAAELGPAAEAISRLWRVKQLEYSWVRALMGRHADFWTVTGEALDTALATHGQQDTQLRRALLDAYLELDAYPEVPAMLAKLGAGGMRAAILSNGTPDMLARAVASAGIGRHLEAVLSVEQVGVFKPDQRVYRLATEELGVPPDAVCFMSSNPWDGAGASAFGFQVVWVNRGDQPAEYGWVLRPTVVGDLGGLPALLGAG